MEDGAYGNRNYSSISHVKGVSELILQEVFFPIICSKNFGSKPVPGRLISTASEVIVVPLSSSFMIIILTRFDSILCCSDIVGDFFPLPLAFSINLIEFSKDVNWFFVSA